MILLNKFKHYLQNLTRYPRYQEQDQSHDGYWQNRDIESGKLNSFQKWRADFLLRYLRNNDSVMDVGCGDGVILVYLRNHRSLGQLIGIDSSAVAISKARQRGIEVIQGDISKPSSLPAEIGEFDYVLLLEVLEHLPNSEELLNWALNHVQKALIFSVPNTGFIVHRLRLLLGRFPLQWKAHPSEHLRFWTIADMKWWLNQLGFKNYKLDSYEGIPVLNKIWPTLFSQGMIVVIDKKTEI